MPDIASIKSAITDEIFFALGLARQGFLRQSMGWLFGLPTGIFARYIASVDQAVARGHLVAACQEMLDSLGIEVRAKGISRIPVEGPTIILANHPGAYDSVAIGSLLPRSDLKIIVSNTHFYHVLQNIYPRLICVSQDIKERFVALRAAVDHLRQGGILLQFGSGLIEPDPATHPVEEGVFEKWSRSIEVFLLKVKDLCVIPTIASGVLLERFESNVLTKLRKEPMDKRRLAEFVQIIQQLIFPESVLSYPKISFGEPFTLADLACTGTDLGVMSSVLSRVQAQLSSHQQWIAH